MKAVLVVHGGAGRLTREVVGREQEQECQAALETALRTGYQVLRRGATALDAVEAAVRFLEDCPLFNAGHGACLNSQGAFELDACIMDGATRRAGAVACITAAKNPVSVARAVMVDTDHVMLCGLGANEFATRCGAELVDQSYFFTEKQQKFWQQAKEKSQELLEEKFGTVGAVAVDNEGRLAAATSTGGTVNKMLGRIGDTPIVGAGNYADDLVAVSGTGQGEFFIRLAAAHEVAALMHHSKAAVSDAVRHVVAEIGKAGGKGGLIAIDKDGNYSMTFNSEGMYRGYITDEGDTYVAVFRD